jgi:hypothetical protein
VFLRSRGCGYEFQRAEIGIVQEVEAGCIERFGQLQPLPAERGVRPARDRWSPAWLAQIWKQLTTGELLDGGRVPLGPEPGGGDDVEHGVDRTIYDEVMAHLRHGCSSLELCAPEGSQPQQGYVTRVGSGSPGRGAV